MKNNFFKFVKYLYYFSLITLFAIYLFPGSLIGYLFYGDLGQQPNLIPNPIGTSINHLICFSFITLFATIIRPNVKNILTNYKTILFVSLILEISHFIIPNRAFEFYDLIANILGVMVVLLLKKLKKWQNFS